MQRELQSVRRAPRPALGRRDGLTWTDMPSSRKTRSVALTVMCAPGRKRITAELVLAICGGDVQKYVALVGMGNAAGLLQEKNLLQAFSQGAQIMNG